MKITEEEKKRIKEKLQPSVNLLINAWNEGRMLTMDYIEFIINVKEIEEKKGIKLLKRKLNN